MAVAHDEYFLIALPYGDRTDWLKNVRAQGSATLVSGGQEYRVGESEVVPMAEVSGYFRPREQRLQRRFKVESALRLRRGRPAAADLPDAAPDDSGPVDG